MLANLQTNLDMKFLSQTDAFQILIFCAT